MPIVDYAGYVLSVSKAFVSSRKGSSHPTRDVLKTKNKATMCGCNLCSDCSGLSSADEQCFIHGVQILFSCDEDNAPKLLQYWSLLQKMFYTLVIIVCLKACFQPGLRMYFYCFAQLAVEQAAQGCPGSCYKIGNQLTQSKSPSLFCHWCQLDHIKVIYIENFE